jgi:hypothetical protein
MREAGDQAALLSWYRRIQWEVRRFAARINASRAPGVHLSPTISTLALCGLPAPKIERGPSRRRNGNSPRHGDPGQPGQTARGATLLWP